MKQSSFDSWLATQNDEPTHFVFDITSNNYDWSIEHSEIDGSCYHCNINLGINSDHGSTTNYWQIDIDAELLFCDECYNELVSDQPLVCCCQEGWCGACQIHGENQ